MPVVQTQFALPAGSEVFRAIVGRQSRLSNHLKGLILAQNERWRRGLGMQVEREVFLRENGKRQTG